MNYDAAVLPGVEVCDEEGYIIEDAMASFVKTLPSPVQNITINERGNVATFTAASKEIYINLDSDIILNQDYYYPADPLPSSRNRLVISDDAEFVARRSGNSISISVVRLDAVIVMINLTQATKIVSMGFSGNFRVAVFADEQGNIYKLNLNFLNEFIAGENSIENDFYNAVPMDIPVRINSVESCLSSENDAAGSENLIIPEFEEDRTFCTVCQEFIKKREPVFRIKCNHVYHLDCMKNHVSTDPKCTICREDVREGEEVVVNQWNYKGDGTDKHIGLFPSSKDSVKTSCDAMEI